MNTPIEDLFALAEEAIRPVIWPQKKARRKFQDAATPELLHEVAEAFRALERRAELAETECARLDRESQNLSNQLVSCDRERVEAKTNLAELVKQRPVGKQYRVSAKGNNSATGWSLWHDGDGEQYKNSYDVETREVFTRPAPAVNLVDLVQVAKRLKHHYMCNEGRATEFIACHTPGRSTIGTGQVWDDWRELSAILRNIEEANGQTIPAAKVGSVADTEVQAGSEASGEEKSK